jgi:hypothetical protein
MAKRTFGRFRVRVQAGFKSLRFRSLTRNQLFLKISRPDIDFDKNRYGRTGFANVDQPLEKTDPRKVLVRALGVRSRCA